VSSKRHAPVVVARDPAGTGCAMSLLDALLATSLVLVGLYLSAGA
jgi:hypothetical protein